jgi:hypothetical protein
MNNFAISGKNKFSIPLSCLPHKLFIGKADAEFYFSLSG